MEILRNKDCFSVPDPYFLVFICTFIYTTLYCKIGSQYTTQHYRHRQLSYTRLRVVLHRHYDVITDIIYIVIGKTNSTNTIENLS